MTAIRWSAQRGLLRPVCAAGGWVALVGGCALLLAAHDRLRAAGADPAGKSRAAQTAAAKAEAPSKPLPEPDLSKPLAQRYCEAIRDKAAEARFSIQAAHLEALSKDVKERIAQLEARSAELKQWMAKRDAFSQQATAHLIGIFSAMRPESAAEQIVRMNETMGAAIVSKLEARAASAILNEMPPDKSARLTSIIANAARKNDGKDIR